MTEALSQPLQATMMHAPMTVRTLMHHGARIHGDARVVNFDGENVRPVTFAEVADRAEHLAGALAALGVGEGDVVATLCWNHSAHLEAYLAVPSMGAVLHTLNLRLFPEQLAWIMNDARDRVLIVDASLVHLLDGQLEALPELEHLIVIGGGENPSVDGRAAHDYDALVAGAERFTAWPEICDTRAAALCYTSGTTGNPKGVAYGHRTVFVHSLASMGRDTFGIGQDDRILLLPPMFHANAWGLPYSGWLAGADILMPADHMKPAEVRRLIELERPTFTAMVPTLINDLLRANEEAPLDMSTFRMLVSGGSPVAPALIDRVRETWGVPVLQGWGMTETSPLCALSVPPRGTDGAEETPWRATAGRPVPGMQVRLRTEDGQPVPENGEDVGELQLRGHWVTGSYLGGRSPDSFTEDGWLRTGDVGSIDAKGYVRITDRIKDVIKSGGEWISSVELENLLLEAPSVAEVAVIGIPDSRWEERPLAVVVTAEGEALEPEALRGHLDGRTAKFAVPEYWAAMDALPRTSVGKIDKRRLRELADTEQIEVQRVR